MSPDQIAVLESRLETAQSKGKSIDQRVEESRKDLEKVVTTTIKKESEKVKQRGKAVIISQGGFFLECVVCSAFPGCSC